MAIHASGVAINMAINTSSKNSLESKLNKETGLAHAKPNARPMILINENALFFQRFLNAVFK